jgi:hypothetical protein
MATQEQVRVFLNAFFAKKKSHQILYLDRNKNLQALLYLGMTRLQRDEIVDSLVPADYYKGPRPDAAFGGAEMWEFGKVWRNKEIYIKITMGVFGAPVLCISFHEPEREMKLPYKKP